MYPALDDVASHRFARLAPKLANKSYRDNYVSMQLRVWLADQVRNLRGDMTQAEFGKVIGKPQTVVSRLEDPDYGRLTIETLLDVAQKLDIALVVRFVDHATFLMATNDFSDNALRPNPYNQATINALAAQSPATISTGAFPSGTFSVSTGNAISFTPGIAEMTVNASDTYYVSGSYGGLSAISAAAAAAAPPSWSWTPVPALIGITDEREVSNG